MHEQQWNELFDYVASKQYTYACQDNTTAAIKAHAFAEMLMEMKRCELYMESLKDG